MKRRAWKDTASRATHPVRAAVAAIALGILLASCTTSLTHRAYNKDGGTTGAPRPELAVSTTLRQPGVPPGPSAGMPAPETRNTEEYTRLADNPFRDAETSPVSTFSVDVDTASYANTRRFLRNEGRLPYADAVRIEELVNYFPYGYPEPPGDRPVGATLSLAKAPWAPAHHLLRIAVKARTVATADLPPTNLVFLLDTSGSMHDPAKLPLLKESLRILVGNLRAVDRVSIVAYAGSAGLVLPPTRGDRPERILAAVDRLEAGGSTAGGAGIALAYSVALENFVPGGNNRIVLATDGDFNVGVSSTSELTRTIESHRDRGIYLTALGFGMGNYKDSRLESLAAAGNGNYAYIDTLGEARKALGSELWGTLFVVARDVKVQVEFNPALVRSYRLLGYENRLLAREDFNDDTKDAGDMGSGQTVTALYELVPAGTEGGSAAAGAGPPPPDPLVFQTSVVVPSDDLLVFRLRYKDASASAGGVPGAGLADGEGSRLLSERLPGPGIALAPMDDDFAFASAVAEFGMLLRNSPHRGGASWDDLVERADRSRGRDPGGHRADFVALARRARELYLSEKR